MYEDGLKLSPTLADRVQRRLRVAPSGCVEWTGPLTGSGYGSVSVGVKDGRNYVVGVHRVMYSMWVGPIQPGMVIDHLCRNKSCCNPQHLEAVTHVENLMRGVGPAKSRARMLDPLLRPCPPKPFCKRGHAMTEENIMYRRIGSRQCRACNRLRSWEWRRRGGA